MKCQECKVNDAEYLFINGEEKLYLCEPSMQEELLELVTGSYETHFRASDYVKGKIQTIEVV